MKAQTTKKTKKWIMNNYDNVISIPQLPISIEKTLLYCYNARYFTAGVYGWNADIYDITNRTCIVVGDRPFGNINADYNTTIEYCKKAKEAIATYNTDGLRFCDVINALWEFLDKTTNNNWK